MGATTLDEGPSRSGADRDDLDVLAVRRGHDRPRPAKDQEAARRGPAPGARAHHVARMGAARRRVGYPAVPRRDPQRGALVRARPCAGPVVDRAQVGGRRDRRRLSRALNRVLGAHGVALANGSRPGRAYRARDERVVRLGPPPDLRAQHCPDDRLRRDPPDGADAGGCDDPCVPDGTQGAKRGGVSAWRTRRGLRALLRTNRPLPPALHQPRRGCGAGRMTLGVRGSAVALRIVLAIALACGDALAAWAAGRDPAKAVTPGSVLRAMRLDPALEDQVLALDPERISERAVHETLAF